MRKFIYLVLVFFIFVGCSSDDVGNEFEIDKTYKVVEQQSINYISVYYNNGTTTDQIEAIRERYFSSNFQDGQLDGKSFPQFYTVELLNFDTNNSLQDIWIINKWTLGKPGLDLPGQLGGEDDVDYISGW